jgi:hypothetical protein
LGAAEPRYVLQSPGLVENCVGLYVPLLEFNQVMEYEPGGDQAWQHIDLGYQSAYPTITGGILEFGFTDAILQMLAAFCDEL